MDIIGQILEAVDRSSGLTKLRIMHRAYISFMQATDYLSLLTEKCLLKYDENTQTYSITEKGQLFLRKYNQMGEVIGNMQVRI